MFRPVVSSCLLFACLASSAQAVIVLSDDFNYPDADLGSAGQNGGFGFSGPWQHDSGPMSIVQIQNQAINSNPPSAGAVPGVYSRPFSTGVAPGTTLYFGFDMQMLNDGEGAYTFDVQFAGTSITAGINNDAYQIRLGSDTQTAGPVDIQPHTFVGRIEFDAVGSDEIFTLWQDPASEGDAPLLVAQDDIGILDLGSALGIFNVNNDVNEIVLDNFQIGTDFNFSQPAQLTPEPGTLLLFVAMAGMFAGWRWLRRSGR